MKRRKKVFKGFLTSLFAMLAICSLVAMPVHAGTVTLTWTAPTTDSSGNALTGLTGYKVYYGTSSGVYSSSVTLGNVTSHQMTLADGSTYYFVVTAMNSSGESGYSNEASKTLAASDTTPPVISAVASAQSSSTSATITWTTNEQSDTTVRYGTSQTSLSSTVQSGTMTTSHSIAITNLSSSTTYYYQAVSKDASGNSASSSVYSFTTPDTVAPGNPSGFTATDTGAGSAVAISWINPGDSDFAGVKVVSATGATAPSSCSSGTLVYSGKATSHTASGLTNNTQYSFRICSYDTTGNYSAGVTASATPSDTTAPGQVTGFSAAAGTNQAVLSWTNPADSDLAGVKIVSATGSTAPASCSTGTLVYSGTGTSYTATGLANGTQYSMRICSYDTSGNYSSGVTASFTLNDTTPPGQVTGVTAVDTGKGSSIAMSWTNPADLDFAGVKIVSATGSTAPASCSTGTTVYTGSGTSYTATGLTNNTQYSFRICSYDTTGNYSTGVTASATPKDTTAPGAVTGLTATAGANQAVLSWTTPTDSDFAGTKIARKAGSAPSSCSDSTATVIFTGLGNAFTDTGLLTGSGYYYAACSYDTSLNYASAATASVNLSADSVAPGQVTDLKSAQPYTRALSLGWTAPGDDGSLGTAKSYDLRITEAVDYPASMISTMFSSNWSGLTQVTGMAAPQSAGSTENLSVTSANTGGGLDLMPNTLYYVAMKATDDSGNASQVSNVVAVHTALKDGYNSVSVPFNFGSASASATVSSIFGDNVSPVSMQVWAPTGLDSSSTFSGSWVTVDPASQVSSLTNGKGYYIYASALNASVLDEKDSSGNAVVASNTSNWTRIDLAQGRNLIGDPYLKNVDFTNIKVCKNPTGFSADTGCSGGTVMTFQDAVSAGALDGDIAYFANANTFTYEICNKIECTAKLRPWWGQWIYLLDKANTYMLAVPKP